MNDILDDFTILHLADYALEQRHHEACQSGTPISRGELADVLIIEDVLLDPSLVSEMNPARYEQAMTAACRVLRAIATERHWGA